MIRRLLFLTCLTWAALFAAMSNAQCVSLTTVGSAYTQNFDTLSNTAGSTTNNLTIPGWFMTETGGGGRDNEQYGVDTGASTTGDTYSYGAAGSTDRALGGAAQRYADPELRRLLHQQHRRHRYQSRRRLYR